MIESRSGTHLDVVSLRPELQGHALAYSKWRVSVFGVGADDPDKRERFFRAVLNALEVQALAGSTPFPVRGRFDEAGTDLLFFTSAMGDETALQESTALGQALAGACAQVVRQDPRFAGLMMGQDFVADAEALPPLTAPPSPSRVKP